MPTLDWNFAQWDGEYPWQREGEEWSEGWGGSRAQWFGTIYPRISRWLPANSILEIAPGFGRWTKFLKELAVQEYYGVDLSKKCIAACRQRFSTAKKAQFFVNDGLSLDRIPDGSVDFVFSVDSLVHAEIDVLRSYVPQILKKLTPNGMAFLHHSNSANHPDSEQARKGSRALSVSSELVGEAIDQAGGCQLIQEEINWGGGALTDCFTTFCRSESVFAQPAVKIQNSAFFDERTRIKATHAPYHNL